MAHGLGRAASYNSFGIRVRMTMILETHWDKIVILAYVSRFIEVFHYFGTRFHDSDEQNKGIFRVYFFFTLFGWITVMKTDELEDEEHLVDAFGRLRHWSLYEVRKKNSPQSWITKFAFIRKKSRPFRTCCSFKTVSMFDYEWSIDRIDQNSFVCLKFYNSHHNI